MELPDCSHPTRAGAVSRSDPGDGLDDVLAGRGQRTAGCGVQRLAGGRVDIQDACVDVLLRADGGRRAISGATHDPAGLEAVAHLFGRKQLTAVRRPRAELLHDLVALRAARSA